MELGHAPQITQPQQATDLHLFLLDRPLHPELFQHRADYCVKQGNYRADIWITGLGHVVTVSEGAMSATELVAAESDAIPQRGVLTRFRLKGERDLDRNAGDGWTYMTSSQVETMDAALYKSVHLDLQRHAERKGWVVTYDEWTDGELVPFSHVDIEARDREFHVHVFHAYPAERTLVKTQSLFDLPK